METPNPVLKPGSDWTGALPHEIPPPTLWPAFLALGATLLVWGLISSHLISLIGVVLFIISLVGWIGNLRHERIQAKRSQGHD